MRIYYLPITLTGLKTAYLWATRKGFRFITVSGTATRQTLYNLRGWGRGLAVLVCVLINIVAWVALFCYNPARFFAALFLLERCPVSLDTKELRTSPLQQQIQRILAGFRKQHPHRVGDGNYLCHYGKVPFLHSIEEQDKGSKDSRVLQFASVRNSRSGVRTCNILPGVGSASHSPNLWNHMGPGNSPHNCLAPVLNSNHQTHSSNFSCIESSSDFSSSKGSWSTQ